MKSSRFRERACERARSFSSWLVSFRTSSSTRLWKPVSSATFKGYVLRPSGTQSDLPEPIQFWTSKSRPTLHSRRSSLASVSDNTSDTSKYIHCPRISNSSGQHLTKIGIRRVTIKWDTLFLVNLTNGTGRVRVPHHCRAQGPHSRARCDEATCTLLVSQKIKF